MRRRTTPMTLADFWWTTSAASADPVDAKDDEGDSEQEKALDEALAQLPPLLGWPK